MEEYQKIDVIVHDPIIYDAIEMMKSENIDERQLNLISKALLGEIREWPVCYSRSYAYSILITADIVFLCDLYARVIQNRIETERKLRNSEVELALTKHRTLNNQPSRSSMISRG